MMDKNREAFEEWYLKDPENSPAYLASDDRGYLDDTVQMDWTLWSEAWQASRQAIEVDLESVSYVQVEEGTFYLSESDVNESLTSIGIRVKGNEE